MSKRFQLAGAVAAALSIVLIGVVLMAANVSGGSPGLVRRGADDPAGDNRGGHGGDDPAGDDKSLVRRGGDDPAGDDRGGHGGDDPAGDV